MLAGHLLRFVSPWGSTFCAHLGVQPFELPKVHYLQVQRAFHITGDLASMDSEHFRYGCIGMTVPYQLGQLYATGKGRAAALGVDSTSAPGAAVGFTVACW